MRAAFHTFGCKLNQYETEALASAFRSRGFFLVPVGEEAELYLINTCTVTSRSEQKARRLIRQVARRRPAALVVVTGCYAQLNRRELAGLGANVAVVPQEVKDRLLELPAFLAAGNAPGWLERLRGKGGRGHGGGAQAAFGPGDPFAYSVERFSFHSRAFLKVQDGCDYRCSYCRVPLARGGAVSLPPEEAVRRLGLLERAGHREVVLTGVNLSAYRYGERRLPELLERLLAAGSGARLRLSSLEPETIRPALARVLAHPRICPHFHLPVQSGSDAVLLAMRRRYRAARVREAAVLLRNARPEAFLAADVIVGFPGETREDFLATRALVEELAFARLHVFPFSPRGGTRAEGMAGRVPERQRDARAAELIALSEVLHARYRGGWVGRRVEAVLERSGSGGLWRGLSQNYLRLSIRGVPAELGRPGELVAVRVENDEDPAAALFVGAVSAPPGCPAPAGG